MRDLAFDIRAHDTTQAAFASAGRNAREFGRDLDRNGRAAFDAAAGAADRFAAATDRAAAAGRRLSSANDNWRRRNLMMQGFDVGQMLALGQNPMTTMLQQGPQIAQMYAGQGGVRAALSDTLGMAKSLAGGMGLVGTAFTAAAGIGVAALAGMQHEINKTGDRTVSFGDVARGAFEVTKDGLADIGTSIWTELKPAVDAMAPWFSTAWDTIVSGFKIVNNALIAGWKTAFDAIRTVWGSFPSIMGDLAFQAGEAFLAGTNVMLNKAVDSVKRFYLTVLNPMAGAAKAFGFDELSKWTGGNLFDGFKADFSMGTNPWADAAGKAGKDIFASAKENFAADPLGDYFELVKQATLENAKLADAAGKAGGAMKAAANDNIDPWKGLRHTVKATADETQSFMRGLVQGFTQDIRNALQDGKITLEEWGNIASNVLNKITDKLLNDVLDAMSQVNKGSSSLFAGAGAGGGGGLLGGLLGGLFGLIGNLFGFANGGSILPGGSGTTDGQVVAFRKSPAERVDVYHPGQGGGGGSIAEVRVYVDRDGNWQAAVERIAAGKAAIAAQGVARQVPRMVDDRLTSGQTRKVRA